MDSQNVRGWWFRLCLHGKIPTHQKMFSDGIYGSRINALNQAIRYRNKLLMELEIENRLNFRARVQEPHRSNTKNSSGVIGITLGKTCRRDNVFYDWRACWNEDGKQHIKSFGLIKYGNCKAFRLACKTRYEKAGRLYIYKNKKLPCRLPSGVRYKFIDKDKSHKS